MKKVTFTDTEKLQKIIRNTGVTRSELARRLQVGYKTVYRWLDLGIKPQPKQSAEIDQLFKEYVDIRDIIYRLAAGLPDPLSVMKKNGAAREKFLLEMTYNSNAIEGSRMTKQETKAAFEGKNVRGKEFLEVLEAVNHRNALEYLIDTLKPNFRITEDFILGLHEKVMRGFNNKLPGKYRTGYVNLTNTEKRLPTAQEVPLRMGRLIKNISTTGGDVIENAARCHYEFEAVHPFFDGNGRVGRLVLIAQLLSRNFAPAVIKIEDRYKYYAALAKGDSGELANMVQMVSESVIEGYNLISG
ncbi:MAG: Fic family protein [Endomicrobiales bacterium]|nr:Fic family protein [Endomicrobiales bacterium]